MLADTTDELVKMADHLGIARKWIQKRGTPEEHFDIALSKKKMALTLGAIEVDDRRLVEIIQTKRAANGT